jgi:hypothetical protein
MPLEAYITRIMDYGLRMPGADMEALRDRLVMDWLRTNHVGTLPLCLQREDPLNRKAKQILDQHFRADEKSTTLGTRRAYGFGLLYGMDTTQVAFADYRKPNPPLGHSPHWIMSIEEIKEKIWQEKL